MNQPAAATATHSVHASSPPPSAPNAAAVTRNRALPHLSPSLESVGSSSQPPPSSHLHTLSVSRINSAAARPRLSTHSDEPAWEPLRRFIPQPVETVRRSNRRVHSDATQGETEQNHNRRQAEGSASPFRSSQQHHQQKRPRKFAPQLIETASRSFRSQSASPSSHRHPPYTAADSSHVPESRYSYSSLLQREAQSQRRHSFQIPDLPSIPSSNSERTPTSDSSSPSASISPPQWPNALERGRLRHRVGGNERSTGQLLSLAAQSVGKQLEEQALMESSPDEQDYHRVEHFGLGKSDEVPLNNDNRSVTQPHRSSFRRRSSLDLGWALEYMRRHKEEAVRRRRGEKMQCDPERPPPVDSAIEEDDGASDQMRNAHPPTLGGDLVFPQSMSPRGSLRPSTPIVGRGSSTATGLWSSATPNMLGACRGLWMGTCSTHSESEQASPEAIMPGILDTRTHEPETTQYDDRHNEHSPSPPSLFDQHQQSGGLDPCIDEEEVQREFDDVFVTQIYNYLSLGFPCVARFYDGELSKVSGIPIEELRQNDMHTDPRGYMLLPDDSAAAGSVAGGICKRWIALRRYIHDWASHQSNYQDDGQPKSWGVCERRGSWAG